MVNMNRVIAERTGESHDVLLIILGAIHGNETEGLSGINNIINFIDEEAYSINGKLLAIAGNTKAIAAKKRYIDYDLNRVWTKSELEKIKLRAKEERLAEDEEVMELMEILHTCAEMPYRKKYLIDLHTTSSSNGNFLVYNGDPEHSEMVSSLKLPVVINLEKYITGTLMLYARALGIDALVFEGGKIGSQKSIELHTYGLWQILTSCGLIDEPHEISKHIHYEELITSLKHPNPSIVQVLHRHERRPKDQFRMKPGFRNFQKIERGELLAADCKGEIYSPINGFIFMPLYQLTGNDGFFIVDEV